MHKCTYISVSHIKHQSCAGLLVMCFKWLDYGTFSHHAQKEKEKEQNEERRGGGGRRARISDDNYLALVCSLTILQYHGKVIKMTLDRWVVSS